MADMLTLYEHFGHLDGLHVVYVGDFNNVTRSLAEAAARFGQTMTISCPEGYGPDSATCDQLRALGLTLTITANPVEAVAHADVIYTDTWVSMGQETEATIREQVFPPYQINAALLAHAPARAVVMHCLPAHRGHEITDDVADGPQSLIFPQAENRLHAQKAILVHLMRGY
jgi:ornithine carbamoyltransferase